METMEKVPAQQVGARTNREEEDTIDLLELFFVLWQKAWVLLLSLLIGALAAGLWTQFMITPQYQASSMIYIFSKSSSLTSLADLQIGTQLTGDFQIFATSRPVIEKVIRELDLDATYEQLTKIVEISNPGNSRILQITVTHPDPQLAADISNEMADVLRDRVAEVTNSDRPTIVENAVAPTKKYSPSLLKNVAVGGVLCLCIAGGVIVLLYLLDDTIQSEEDVERYLGMNVLAAIPMDSTQTEEKGPNKFRRRRGSSRKNSLRLPAMK